MRVACVYGFESIMKYVRNFLARQFVLVCSACINNNISMCIRSKYHLKNKNALMMAHSIQKRLPQLICSHLYSHEVYHKTITICIKFIRREKKRTNGLLQLLNGSVSICWVVCVCMCVFFSNNIYCCLQYVKMSSGYWILITVRQHLDCINLLMPMVFLIFRFVTLIHFNFCTLVLIFLFSLQY